MKIIVADLTRFSNEKIVCTAGIDPVKKRCIRPMPYLKSRRCQELNLLPGAVLEGDFSKLGTQAPHVEDMGYQKLRFVGPCSCDEFKQALLVGAAPSLAEGFGVALGERQKHIPLTGKAPPRSIMTLPVNPADVEIVTFVDNQGNVKIKAHITDMFGCQHRFLAITDLGFYNYAQRKVRGNKDLGELNEFIQDQEEVLVRISLGRSYKSPDGREGYWIQVNGIYTFPDYYPEIRCYT